MLTADRTVLRKLAPHLERVLVLDPIQTSGKLMIEVMRDFGARNVSLVQKTTTGIDPVMNYEPQLILTELSGPDFDGLTFIRNLRRSRLQQRTVPIILYTAVATVDSIKGARDAGAHEFLRKPYTIKDLFKRVENVILKPRDWIEAQMYVGPDRRRFNSESYTGARKRKAEALAAKSA
jgi:DNA-binding response OmpR family regulator